WDGFRNGAISSSLNHVVHMIQNKKIDIEKIIKEYEKNEKRMIDNTMKIDSLKNFTRLGQLRKLIETGVTEWVGRGAETSGSNQILSDISKGMLALGITVSSSTPQIRTASSILVTRYMAENFYLTYENASYKPLIVRYAPHYALNNGMMTYQQQQNYYERCNCGGSFGGGGAGGRW
ncbi:MAG: hypothetical protein ACWIPI_08160, partial [Polaribacter sp.]